MEMMELIASAPWRSAVTYEATWPHEYVVITRGDQEELMNAFCERIRRGEGVECWFFHQQRPYLFLGDHKYWMMTHCDEIDLDAGVEILNRARLYQRPQGLRHSGRRHRHTRCVKEHMR